MMSENENNTKHLFADAKLSCALQAEEDSDISHDVERLIGFLNTQQFRMTEVFDLLERLLKSGNVYAYAAVCRTMADQLKEAEWKPLCEAAERHFHIRAEDVQRLLKLGCKKDERKSIAFYSNVWTFGGIERVCSLLMEELKKDFSILLITGGAGYAEGEEGFAVSSEITHVRMMDTADSPIYQRITFACLLAGVDVFIGNPNIMTEFLPIYAYMKPSPIKTVACNHYFYGLPYLSDELGLKKVVSARREGLRHADVCVWLTNFSAVSARELNPHTVRIANPNTFSEMEQHALPQKKVVLAIGRFDDAVKRIDRVFDVFGHVLDKEPDAELWLVGEYKADMVLPGTRGETIGQYVQNYLGIPEASIRYCGKQRDVVPYFKEASVLLLASDCEGYPMVLREAGVAGVPVIVSDYPGSSDIIEQGINGYRVDFDVGDYEKAADYICKLMQDRTLWKKMSIEAQRMARETDISVIGKQWRKLFDMLTDHHEEEYASILKASGFLPDEREERQIYAEAKKFMESRLDKSIEWQEKCLIMEASLSWRLTKPVRWLSGLRRKIRKQGLSEAIKGMFL